MFCTSCGAKLNEDARFCHVCGATYDQEQPAPQPVTPEPAPVVQQPVSAPKKKKKTGLLIGIVAAVTAMALIVGCVGGLLLFSGKETVYLCTAIRKYDARGTNHTVITYEFDKNGRLLYESKAVGPQESVWDDELGIYVYIMGEANGDVESSTTYRYDKNGNLIFYEDYFGDSSYGHNIWWDYSGKQPKSLHMETLDEPKGTSDYDFEYNNGNLTAVIFNRKDGTSYKGYMAEYDQKGRMTREVAFYMEGGQIYDYEYDLKGNLSKVYYSSCINDSYRQETALENAVLRYMVEYEYDSKGNLLGVVREEHGNRTHTAVYEYDSKGRLVSKETENGYYEFEYNGKKLSSATCDDVRYEYDRNGNLIRISYADGKYVEYEYKKVHLSQADAAAYHRWEHREARISSAGTDRTYSLFHYLFPTPESPELMSTPRTE